MTIGELIVRLGADFSQFNKDLAQAEKQAKAAGLRIGDIFKNALSFTLGMGLFEAIRRGFQTVVGEAVNFNAMMEQAQIGFTTMLGSAEKAQAFLDEMAAFAARTPFEYPELLDAAKRMMAMGFAAEEVLPTLRAVGDAAAGLGLGKEGIDRITLALGQMRAKSKVSGEEMRQLTEAGIPAWEILAEAMGKSTAEVMKLSEKGLIPANQAIQILVEGMEKRFPNMMQNMENTWEGVTSTIRDVWRMTIGALTSNLFKGLVRWLQGVREWATEFYNTFRQFGLNAALTKMFGAEFAGVISTITSILRGFWNTARAVAQSIARNWAIIRPIVLGAATAFLSFKLATLIITLAQKAVSGLAFVMAVLRGEAVATSGILNFVARAVQIYRLQLHLASMAGITHVGVLQTIRTALYSVWTALGPLGWAIIGVSAALTAGIGLWMKYVSSVEKANLEKVMEAQNKQFADSAGYTKSAADNMGDLSDKTKKASKAAHDNLQSFDEIHSVMEDISSTEPQMPELGEMGGLENLGDLAKMPGIDLSAIEQVKPTLAGFWDWIKQGFANAWDWIKQKTGTTWDWIKEKTGTVWDWIKEKVGNTWDWLRTNVGPYLAPVGQLIGTMWGNAKTLTVDILKALKDFVVGTFRNIFTFSVETTKATVDFVVNLWSNLLQFAKNIFLNIYNFVSGTWQNIKQFTINIWKSISDFVIGTWQNIKTFAGNIWTNISDLIKGKIDLRTFVINVWGAIKDFLFNQWNLIKDFGFNIWTAVNDFIRNQWTLTKQFSSQLWNDIKTFLINNWTSIKDFASSVWSTTKDFIINQWTITKEFTMQIWGAIKNYVINNWTAIKNFGASAFSGLRDTLVNITTGLQITLINIFESIKNRLLQVFSSIQNVGSQAFNGLLYSIKSAVNSILKALNWMIGQLNKIHFSIPSWVPVLGGKSWGFNIPYISLLPMAAGGVVTKPTPALIGEAGPEAVMPLSPSSPFIKAIHDAVYEAIVTALSEAITQSNKRDNDKIIVLEVNGRELARTTIEDFATVAKRLGVKFG